ncbi:MAG: hypothetical protein GY801_44825 [bacterium]|nr:hypothetical protein [bacterium]
MRTRKTVHLLYIICLAALGTSAYAQYKVGSVEHSESTAVVKSAYEEDRGLKGEWIESIDNALVISSANQKDSRPQTYPYFYLSRNWKQCVEFTADSPQGRACSSTFHGTLKNADAFLLKG